MCCLAAAAALSVTFYRLAEAAYKCGRNRRSRQRTTAATATGRAVDATSRDSVATANPTEAVTVPPPLAQTPRRVSSVEFLTGKCSVQSELEIRDSVIVL